VFQLRWTIVRAGPALAVLDPADGREHNTIGTKAKSHTPVRREARCVHADLAPPSTLAVTHEHGSVLRIQVTLAQCERLFDPTRLARQNRDHLGAHAPNPLDVMKERAS